MWFLECEGDLLGKRVWLRPGTKHILGRTSKPEEGQRVRYIENSSVSRKHLTLEIDHVAAGESTHLHAKTKLTVSDNSKVGTWLNDERLEKGTPKTLQRSENKIKLGNYEHLFHIKWQPLAFSFPSLPRANRQLADPLAAQRRMLEPLGIKCLVDYITQYTTHLVAKKRNTPFTLQALVNARYLVTEDYLKDFRNISFDALEADFAANWPSEQPYSPPPGNEPNPRPDKSPDFLPNSQRSELFSQYTFIFNDAGQHASLMPVITGGGGKALCHPINPDAPDVQDLLQYVREVAGKKSDRPFDLTQQPKTKGGIVVIRIGGAQDIYPGFYDKLDSSLGQSSVEQNELLEVILDVDASKLKRPVKVTQQTTEDAVMDDRAASPPTPQPSQPNTSRRRQSKEATAEIVSATPEDATPEVSQPTPAPTKRRGRKPLTQTKFKGFDEIDMNSLPRYRSPSPSQPQSHEPSQAASVDVMDEDSRQSPSQPAAPSQPSQRPARKRPLPIEEESHQDVVNSMLKGAAAMKKRRIGQGIDKSVTPEEPVVEKETPAPAVKKPKKRKEKEIDVMAEIQERRQAEEEARQKDEEKMRDALEGMDVNEMRNLAQIEEMDMIRHDPPPRTRYDETGGHDDRWDDRWNGRKNFKRFRRQGTTNHTQTRPRVFVSLEEIDPNSHGPSDDYFLESHSTRRSQKSQKKGRSQASNQDDIEVSATPATTSRTATQTQTQTQNRSNAATNSISLISDSEASDSPNEATTFRRRIRASRIQDEETSRAEQILPEEIAGVARDQNIADAARMSKVSAGSRAGPGKRTGRGVVDDDAGKRKKARRPSPDEVSEEDEEVDATRFRRRKR